jgi:hypothetical protein
VIAAVSFHSPRDSRSRSSIVASRLQHSATDQ